MIVSQGKSSVLGRDIASLPHRSPLESHMVPLSEMRSVGLDLRIKAVLDRRLAPAPKTLLKAAFGFVAFGTRMWVHPQFFLIGIGSTEFLRASDQRFKLYKHPFPGLVDLKLPGVTGAYPLVDQKLFSFVQVGFARCQQGISLEGDNSFIVNKASLSDVGGQSYTVEIVLGASTEFSIDIIDYVDDVGLLITRQLADHR